MWKYPITVHTHTLVLCPIQENRFTKCDVCTEVKKEKEKTMDQEKIGELKKMMEEHNNLQMFVRHRVNN